MEKFFDVSKKEMRESELAVLAKEREMELMSENHRVEVKVYQQKVKHLEYEHMLGMRKLAGEEDGMLKAEEDVHLRREAGFRAEKSSLRSRIREMEDSNAESVRAMKLSHEKNILKLRQEFTSNLDALRCVSRPPPRLSILSIAVLRCGGRRRGPLVSWSAGSLVRWFAGENMRLG